MVHFPSSIVTIIVTAIPVVCQTLPRFFPEVAITCHDESHCPENWPCCSQFGQCGTGPFCIGGCNPRLSHKSENCVEQPALLPSMVSNFQLQSSNEHQPALFSTFALRDEPIINLSPNGRHDTDLQRRGIIHYADYLISPEKKRIKDMLRDYHFTYSGYVEYHSPGQLTLGMPKHSTGSLLSSTRSFLYGRSTVKMKTARGRGVVTAIVLISTVGDEIDYEFIGGELFHTQSNYYHQGELNHTRMEKITLGSNSFENTHQYEVDWDKERIHWIVDGAIVRTLYKKDTWNEEKEIFEYPQTPMRLQVSVWPGGREDAHPGTIMWAGGLIDWENSPDILDKGQFFATVESVSITPYENQFWHDILDDLSRAKLPVGPDSMLDITYTYKNDKLDEYTWSENSVIWKRGILPYLDSLDKNGLNRGDRKLGTFERNLQIAPENSSESTNKFIQDITASPNDDNPMRINGGASNGSPNAVKANKQNTQIPSVENSAQNHHSRNPLHRVARLLKNCVPNSVNNNV